MVLLPPSHLTLNISQIMCHYLKNVENQMGRSEYNVVQKRIVFQLAKASRKIYFTVLKIFSFTNIKRSRRTKVKRL